MWALAALARLVLGYAAATGQGLRQPDLGTQLVSYVTQVEAGRWAAAAVVLAAFTATVAAGAMGLSTARMLLVPAVAALAAEVVSAHAGGGGLSGPGSAGPAAVAVIGLHVAGVALWIGPLAGLLLLGPGLRGAAAPAAAGYARSAGWTSGLVAVSGVLAAWQQLGGAGGFRSGYGALVAVKVLVLVLLVALAVRHRRPGASRRRSRLRCPRPRRCCRARRGRVGHRHLRRARRDRPTRGDALDRPDLGPSPR